MVGPLFVPSGRWILTLYMPLKTLFIFSMALIDTYSFFPSIFPPSSPGIYNSYLYLYPHLKPENPKPLKYQNQKTRNQKPKPKPKPPPSNTFPYSLMYLLAHFLTCSFVRLFMRPARPDHLLNSALARLSSVYSLTLRDVGATAGDGVITFLTCFLPAPL